LLTISYFIFNIIGSYFYGEYWRCKAIGKNNWGLGAETRESRESPECEAV
jgi:hypothetical protein